jgi:hypothetical protein
MNSKEACIKGVKKSKEDPRNQMNCHKYVRVLTPVKSRKKRDHRAEAAATKFKSGLPRVEHLLSSKQQPRSLTS